MAKMITRTITVHTYTTGNVDLSTLKVTNIKEHSFPYKLTDRQKRALSKEDGNPILSEKAGECLYAMSIDDFIKYGKPVVAEEDVQDEW